jgi:hypothetical protein
MEKSKRLSATPRKRVMLLGTPSVGELLYSPLSRKTAGNRSESRRNTEM